MASRPRTARPAHGHAWCASWQQAPLPLGCRAHNIGTRWTKPCGCHCSYHAVAHAHELALRQEGVQLDLVAHGLDARKPHDLLHLRAPQCSRRRFIALPAQRRPRPLAPFGASAGPSHPRTCFRLKLDTPMALHSPSSTSFSIARLLRGGPAHTTCYVRLCEHCCEQLTIAHNWAGNCSWHTRLPLTMSAPGSPGRRT